MNANKFVYRGVELDLDLDDLAVDARVDAAYQKLYETASTIDKDEASPASKAQRYVASLRQFLYEVFDREDAGDKLFNGFTKLSEYTEAFGAISVRIGEMRTLVFQQAQGSLLATVTAAKAKATKAKAKK